MTVYSCGCVNRIDSATRILRCVSKCDGHLAEAGRGGLSYFEELGAIRNGIPQCELYERELLDALPELESLKSSGGQAIEIGCGTSGYIPFLLRAGFQYLGIDADDEAARWTRETFDVPTIGLPFECSGPLEPVEMILSAHCLEHFKDAPAMLRKMWSLLKPGGHLVLIVPDDSDPTNPDHLWFFTVATLSAILKKTGFIQIRTAVRKRVDRENFIYCHARKP